MDLHSPSSKRENEHEPYPSTSPNTYHLDDGCLYVRNHVTDCLGANGRMATRLAATVYHRLADRVRLYIVRQPIRVPDRRTCHQTVGIMSTAVPAASTASHARIGHVNLSVGDLDRSLSFYRDVLGMTVQKRIGDAAAFMSFGHYHHDLCINTWHSKAGSAPPKGSTGLLSIGVVTGPLIGSQKGPLLLVA